MGTVKASIQQGSRKPTLGQSIAVTSGNGIHHFSLMSELDFHLSSILSVMHPSAATHLCFAVLGSVNHDGILAR